MFKAIKNPADNQNDSDLDPACLQYKEVTASNIKDLLSSKIVKLVQIPLVKLVPKGLKL